MTTAAAWIPSCRRSPSRPRATSTTCLTSGSAEYTGGVADRGPGLDGRVGDDLRHVVPAVLLRRVADHLVPVAGVEVHVDVGHRDARRVEEALEQQVVLDRIEVG